MLWQVLWWPYISWTGLGLRYHGHRSMICVATTPCCENFYGDLIYHAGRLAKDTMVDYLCGPYNIDKRSVVAIFIMHWGWGCMSRIWVATVKSHGMCPMSSHSMDTFGCSSMICQLPADFFSSGSKIWLRTHHTYPKDPHETLSKESQSPKPNQVISMYWKTFVPVWKNFH